MTDQSRASRYDLEHLRERLSERDTAIIWFVHRHRFATSSQLRRLFFSGHASAGAATRACTRVLDRLLILRLLTRLERRIGGNQRGSAAYVWCLDILGERLTRKEGGSRRRFHEPSCAFLAHTLAITETHVSVREAQRGGIFTVDRFDIETEAWRPYLTRMGTKTMLKPDAMTSLSTTSYTDHWYLEIDRATESLPVLLRKCCAYEDYRHTGRGQAEYGLFPRVLWVMPTPARIARLRAAVAAEPSLPGGLFVYTTPERLIPTLQNPP